jgi:hypothetical protein
MGDVPVKLPDMDALQTDLTAPKLEPQLNNDFLLESKEKMKKRGVRSPDLADALALTFAFNEYFTGVEMQDSQPVTFASPQALQNRPATGYIPPPMAGGATSWMG